MATDVNYPLETDVVPEVKPDKPKPKKEPPGIPKKFIEQLEKAGLYIDPKTNTLTGFPPDLFEGIGKKLDKKELARIVQAFNKATGRETDPERLRLMQQAYTRFGIGNTAYDTSLLVYTPSGYVDLRSGQTEGGSFLSDEELAALRSKVGYDEEVAYQKFVEANTFKLPGGETYTSYAAQDPERFRKYFEDLRRVGMMSPVERKAYAESFPAYDPETGKIGVRPYEETPNAAPSAGPSFLGGFDFDESPSIATGTPADRLIQANAAREKATSLYSDFFAEDELFPTMLPEE